MKIYINKYKNHWISPYTIIDYVFFWTDWSKCSRDKCLQNAIDEMAGDYKYIEHPEWVERWADRLTPISVAIQKVLDVVHPEVKYVKIDRWDTWSMDHTLGMIALPMLKQLKRDKHGAPNVDDEDVPDELKSTSAQPKENDEGTDTDDNYFKRWDYVMDEMIWTFEQKADGNAENKFFTFEKNTKMPWEEGYVSNSKFDEEGYNAWHERQNNGMRLFGKYYDGLWD